LDLIFPRILVTICSIVIFFFATWKGDANILAVCIAITIFLLSNFYAYVSIYLDRTKE